MSTVLSIQTLSLLGYFDPVSIIFENKKLKSSGQATDVLAVNQNTGCTPCVGLTETYALATGCKLLCTYSVHVKP